MSDQNVEKGIFINGRKQIIEMLQYMSETERKKLLENVGARNSMMARELSEQSLSFNDLVNIDGDSLRKIFSASNPAVIGLALYNTSNELQRKVLAVIPRQDAEKAFELMSQNLHSKQTECKRAQDKIIQIAIQMSRRQQIAI